MVEKLLLTLLLHLEFDLTFLKYLHNKEMHLLLYHIYLKFSFYFFPFLLGVSQYGDLHEGHTFGFSFMSLGIHSCLHLSHLNPLLVISTIGMINIYFSSI